MTRPALLFLLLLHLNLSHIFAQQPKVDMRNTHHRLVAVVPMIGAGTAADPRRPQYAPVPVRDAKPDANPIIAFAYQLSDDGKYAIVEFVAWDRSAFQAILADNRPDVRVFEKGKAKRADIEAEFRKYKKNIDLNTLGVMVP